MKYKLVCTSKPKGRMSAKERRWLRRVMKKVTQRLESPAIKKYLEQAYTDFALYGNTRATENLINKLKNPPVTKG